VDGVEAGAIEEGGFEPASYVRHRWEGVLGGGWSGGQGSRGLLAAGSSEVTK
jgi:hypothetical protein